ncbi:MAG: class I tRNA ligase family protein [Euryarchaeota archaeon]|nr:class I tRNA ligase family protein [Euryarchaeota archaeon]
MAYDHRVAEEKWQKKWEEWGIYRFDPESDRPVYSIDTPPPTVSGAMHLGHAFSYSQMDFVARYKRMRGHNLFYPFGTDDNGLPTERLIESIKGVKATEMDRMEFIQLCLSTLEEIRPEFVQGWKDIGISADWGLYYSTIDDHCRRISQKSFLELYRMGREYRKETPFVWCPTCQTAIAQVEMEDREIKSSFNDIVFRLEDGSSLVIATTRPEMLPACVAVFAHPEDERYRHLFGSKARVPVFDFEVPILPDEKADPGKGTGIVMCCTFGDMTDIEWYLEHNLPLKEAITPDGRMTELAGKYQGMTIKEARERIIRDMEEAGLLVGSRDITHHVNVHERCGTEIEILNTKQWFIRYLDLKEEFLKAGREIKWFPEHMRNRYDNWVHGLRWDWCISRQR